MSSKGSALMKSAQLQKTKQAVQLLVEWYASKQDFYKVYLPIQEIVIKRIFNAAEITLNRLKEFQHYFAEEKETLALVYERTEKSIVSDQTKYQPKADPPNDPKIAKGSKVALESPIWCSNIDRVLISLSKTHREKLSRMKKVHKFLEAIQESLAKEQGRYKSELKKFEKQLQGSFAKIDEVQKDQSKIFAKLIKQSKGEQLKDSSYFIGQLKKLQKLVTCQLQLFASRGKKVVDMIQTLLKQEKEASKRVKEELTNYRACKQNLYGNDSKGEQDVWGQVALLEENIEVERVTYFNRVLLKSERIDEIRRILPKPQAKNNWQTILAFLSASKQDFSEIIKAETSINLLFRTISYRCWPQISIAQGWLIESFTASVMYMTYDSIMLIYSLQGQCLKKIHTSASKVGRIQGNVVFLSERIKGFFTDSVEEYKIRFKDLERLEEFQLFIQNQIA